MKEIKNIENKGELLVLIGDMNSHVGNLVKGNEKDKISQGGHQVKDLIESDYSLINASEKVVGGPFTRYDPADPKTEEKKSVLSLCIVSDALFSYVDSLVVDSKMEFTPYRVIAANKVVYTDH